MTSPFLAMLDTIRLRLTGCAAQSTPPRGWRFERREHSGFTAPNGKIYAADCRITLWHAQTGFRVFVDDITGKATGLEVSLSRLLFGVNTTLLKNQDDIDAALARLWQFLAEVATTPEGFEFTRVDLAMQFVGLPANFIRAHESCSYPHCRELPSRVREESLTWGRKKSEFRLCIYDPAAKAGLPPANIVRVEPSLRTRKLRQEFNGNQTPVLRLDFLQCYAVFRRLVTAMQPRAVHRPRSLHELLSFADKEGFRLSGRPFTEHFLQTVSKRQAARHRKEFAMCRPQVFGIDWHALLPAETPPESALVDLTRSPSRVSKPKRTEPTALESHARRQLSAPRSLGTAPGAG